MGNRGTASWRLSSDLLVERRWVVSGTPSNSLIGFEIESALMPNGVRPADEQLKDQLLGNAASNEVKDLVKISTTLTHFLGLPPCIVPRKCSN